MLAEQWKAEGAGVREITRRLNAASHPSKRGGQWHPTTVARLLDPAPRESARARRTRWLRRSLRSVLSLRRRPDRRRWERVQDNLRPDGHRSAGVPIIHRA